MLVDNIPEDLQFEEGEPGTSPEQFIINLWEERKRYLELGRIKRPHPWRAALLNGQVSRRAFEGYVKNRYYFLVNINRKDAQIIANCSIPEARRLLLRKYIDEEGQDLIGGKLGAHYDMWLKVSDFLDIPRKTMNSFRDVLPVYKYTVDAVFHFAKNHTWLEGLAATYATEGSMWRRYLPKQEKGQDESFIGEAEALKRFYGFTEEALEFFYVHGGANDPHGEIAEGLLKKYCVTKELQRKAIAAARFRWDHQEARADIIYRHFVLGES